MGQQKASSVRQRRVSAQLRALRIQRGVTCTDVARAIDCSVSKISRMETGDRGLPPYEVAAILGYLRASGKQRAELMRLVHEGERRNWINVDGDLPKAWQDLRTFEAEATLLQNFEPLLIPGLLQSNDYARAVLSTDTTLDAAMVEKLVRARMGRQGILNQYGGPALSVLIGEMALRCPVGRNLMHGQLHHLLAMAQRPRVEIRVVPFSAGAHAGLDGSFVILNYADEPDLVFVETRGLNAFLEDEQHVTRARISWRDLTTVAMSEHESVEFITRIAEELYRT